MGKLWDRGANPRILSWNAFHKQADRVLGWRQPEVTAAEGRLRGALTNLGALNTPYGLYRILGPGRG